MHPTTDIITLSSLSSIACSPPVPGSVIPVKTNPAVLNVLSAYPGDAESVLTAGDVPFALAYTLVPTDHPPAPGY